MPTPLSLIELQARIRSWEEKLAGAIIPPCLADRVHTAPAREALGNLGRRLEDGPVAPVRIALFGPTGAGKSKLFNSLAGAWLSPASYRRPCTREPVHYLHADRSALSPRLGGKVILHQREELRDLILVDTPDFDSVESANRAIAERIYLESDAFVFVVDLHKYADASVWTYLSRIKAEGKRCLFIINKMLPPTRGGEGSESPGPLEDFRRRLEETFRPAAIPGELIAVGDRLQGDEELIPPDDPGLGAVRSALGRFSSERSGGGRALLAESLRVDFDRFLGAWDRLEGPIREFRRAVARLGSEIRIAFEGGAAALREEFTVDLDPSLRSAVHREVLRRVERLDILRYPRRLLALPLQGVRKALGRLWPSASSSMPGGGGAGGAEGADPFEAANLARLERRIFDLTERAEKSLRGEPACAGILDGEAARLLRPSHEQIRERFRAENGAFKAWAEEQASSAAASLTAEHKVKFFLSQLLYNTVVIGVQVKTAGTLTLTELVTDGVLSPLVAKAVGLAVTSERVKEFEAEARREHAERLSRLAREAGEPYRRLLEESDRGLEAFGALGAEVAGARSASDRLAEMFLAGEAR